MTEPTGLAPELTDRDVAPGQRPVPELSIVTTLYKSQDYIHEFCRRCHQALAGLGVSSEIILVDDGCPESSLEVALEATKLFPGIRLVELSRNFGHHRAMLAGLAEARGRCVFQIDVDLEEPPEVLVDFWNLLHSSVDCDVVYGVQSERKRKGLGDLLGSQFYRLLREVSGLPVPQDLTMTRLMTRDYVTALLSCGESDAVLAGLWSYVGFHQVAMPIEKGSS